LKKLRPRSVYSTKLRGMSLAMRSTEAAREREAQRQRLLMQLLWRDTTLDATHGWWHDAGGARPGRGLQAYHAHAGAASERALEAAFPTLQQLLGTDSFAALARAFWQAQPPGQGDLGCFGAALPAFIEASEQLAGEPCLADCARLDWAVHEAERAADGPQVPHNLHALASDDPAHLALRLRPGTALVVSPHPVGTILQAHRSDAEDRFAPVRAAWASGQPEHVLVWRRGWRAEVALLGAADAAFTALWLPAATPSLASALEQAGAGFAFDAWLRSALQQGWLTSVDHRIDTYNASRT
jgi:Putative DNA-binding domain